MFPGRAEGAPDDARREDSDKVKLEVFSQGTGTSLLDLKRFCFLIVSSLL
jgi:hypothetical protein